MRVIFVRHVDPQLTAVLRAQISWENERKWIGTVAGVYQELDKSLYREVSQEAYERQQQARVERTKR